MEKPQLRMVWPSDRLITPVEARTADSYSIRCYEPGDEESFLSLMAKSDFDPWDEPKVAYNVARALPRGWFFAVENGMREVVGTAVCLHNYSGNSPFTGDVGWVFCDPAHRGRGLGYSLTAHVVRRFIEAGYIRIQLHTEHYRVAAVKTYLKLGFVPVLDSEETRAMWAEACRKVGWRFTPEMWAARV